jgi:signal transduction histidine kinase
MVKSLKGWFKAPQFPGNEDKTRSALLLNVVLNTVLLALPILVAGALLGDDVPRLDRSLTVVASAWIMTILIRWIMLSGRVSMAGKALVGLLFTATTLVVYFIGTIRAPATSFYILTIVIAGLTISRRAILLTSGMCLAAILTFLLTEMNGLLPEPSLAVTITQGVTFSVIIGIVGVMLFLAVKSIDEALARARLELAERLRMERERETYIGELSKQNAELERFAYTVSHDLRNPLVTIKGFLGMLEQDMKEKNLEKIPDDFQRISGAADKMNALLAELLEFSRVGRLLNPPEEIDLAGLVGEAVELLDARLRSKNVVVVSSPDLPPVYGDRTRLREVIENLIDNAAKYTSDQVSPRIEIGIRGGTEPVFFVKDNGMGIEPEYQEKIFGLFNKLDPTSEGTGVGLALVKRIIEFHGGRIWVESEGPGRGSTFCFTIPDGRSQ